jgi:hypothetical protein
MLPFRTSPTPNKRADWSRGDAGPGRGRCSALSMMPSIVPSGSNGSSERSQVTGGYPARDTIYCSIFPSGIVIVVRPMTTSPARMR